MLFVQAACENLHAIVRCSFKSLYKMTQRPLFRPFFDELFGDKFLLDAKLLPEVIDTRLMSLLHTYVYLSQNGTERERRPTGLL